MIRAVRGNIWYIVNFVNMFSSDAQSCLTLCNPMNHSTPGLPVHHQLPEFTQTLIHRVSDAIQPSHPRPLLPLPPIPPSIRVFSNESTLHMRWPKYWSFSFSIIPSKEHPGLISFRMDWLDLLAVQGTLKSLLRHHSSKASILWCSALVLLNVYSVKVKVAQLCMTLRPHGLSVHGILQARILEWVAFPFSRGSSQPRHWTQVYHTAGRFFTSSATREAI